MEAQKDIAQSESGDVKRVRKSNFFFSLILCTYLTLFALNTLMQRFTVEVK